jgi:hypothetical protein
MRFLTGTGRSVRKCTRIRPNGVLDQDRARGRVDGMPAPVPMRPDDTDITPTSRELISVFC